MGVHAQGHRRISVPESGRHSAHVVTRRDRLRRRPMSEVVKSPPWFHSRMVPSSPPPRRDSIRADRTTPGREHPWADHGVMTMQCVDRGKRDCVKGQGSPIRRLRRIVSEHWFGIPSRLRRTAMLESIVSRAPARSSQRSAASSERRAPVTHASLIATIATGSIAPRSTRSLAAARTPRTSAGTSDPLGAL
jgi:hypothetical protein